MQNKTQAYLARTCLIFMVLVFSLVIPTFSIFSQSGSDECLHSFDTFAYLGPRDRNEEIILPLSPWDVEAELPTEFDTGLNHVNQVEIIRSKNEAQEIWVSGYAEDIPITAIYNTELLGWEVISRTVYESDLFVDRLFVTSDGSVWGSNIGNIQKGITNNQFTVLSKFNEIERRFEIPDGVLKIPISQELKYYFGQAVSPFPQILGDGQDGFWIVVNFDGIYHYDTTGQENARRIVSLDLPVRDAILSDDIIYLVAFNSLAETNQQLFTLADGSLLQFNIEMAEELKTISLPDVEYPIFNGIVVTQTGQLWLGSTGYRDRNGDWYLLHPDPEMFFEHAGDPAWAPPRLIMESRDGRLWYQKWSDTGFWNQGTAWYDNDTGTGCMFTNYPANVVEGEDGGLWLIANNTLYKHANRIEK